MQGRTFQYFYRIRTLTPRRRVLFGTWQTRLCACKPRFVVHFQTVPYSSRDTSHHCVIVVNLSLAFVASSMEEQCRPVHGVQLAGVAAAPPAPGSPPRRLAGLLSESFVAWVTEIRELIRYIDERRRDFDGILIERLRRHYESYTPETPKPRKRRRKRKAAKVML